MNKAGSIALLTAQMKGGGVTDHVRALASALEQRGMTVRTFERKQGWGDEMQKQCDHHQISWIGLHFVAYGWARHGLLRQSDINEISSACSGRRIALYLHELWLGENQGASLKELILGYLQKRSLLRLITALKPDRVLTSNPIYHGILSRHQVSSTVMPLYGNLPLPSNEDRLEARAWLAKQSIEKGSYLVALFGTIHPEWSAHDALRDWLRHHPDKPTILLAMGRHGPAGSSRLQQLQQKIPALRIISTGALPAPLLAGLLSECTYGLVTSPWALIAKSGTAAAMCEAGLPVLVTRDDWQWKHGPNPSPSPSPQLELWNHHRPFGWDDFLGKTKPPEQRLAEIAAAWQQIASAP